MKKIIRILSTIMLLAVLFSCTEEVTPTAADPKVIVKTADYYFTDTIPEITATTEVAGKIAWDENQELKPGIATYKWTFTPTDTKAYNVLKGEIELKKVDEIVRGKTFEEIHDLNTAKSIVYIDCTFKNGIKSREEVDVAIVNSEIGAGDQGGGGYKCIYMTSPKSILLDNVLFTGKTTKGTLSTGGYALDLNLYNKEGQTGNTENITIKNCTFTNNEIAISIKCRHGENDTHPDLKDLKTGRNITNGVLIKDCTFAETCNMIYMGTNSKAEDGTKPNYGSGNYVMKLEGNSKVSVCERYLALVSANKTKVTKEYAKNATVEINGPAKIAEAKESAKKP